MAKQVAKKFDANEFLTRHMNEVTTMTPSEYLEKTLKGYVAPVKSKPMTPAEIYKDNQRRFAENDRDRNSSSDSGTDWGGIVPR